MISDGLKSTFSSIKWHEFGLTYAYCPVCDRNRIIVRLHHNEIAVRCLTCRATSVTMSFVSVLRKISPDLDQKEVYELSSRGPLFRYLKIRCRKLTCSEFFDEVEPGLLHNGVQCQDVQKLTFNDCSFDICTSTEVFEHVPDDLEGFREIKRVLRPGGIFIFTVPLFRSSSTVERAKLKENHEIHHILTPQYHGDPIRGHKQILVFRDYGTDITERILSQGFSDAKIVSPPNPIPWRYNRRIIIARK